MSSKSVSKAKEPRDGNGAASSAPPSSTAKRQKIVQASSRSLLLESRPEILRKVYSFLTLKEALVLRRTHRRFNEASDDIFQYSVIMSRDIDPNCCFDYLNKQDRVFCNLSDNDNLRAVLRNETLGPGFVERLFRTFVHFSTTDNGQAISILLQDGRCDVSHVSIFKLQTFLKKGFIAMARALQQDDRVKQMILFGQCSTCAANTGCYICTNKDDPQCINIEYQPLYCHSCVIEDNHFCSQCNGYICRACFEQGIYQRCEKCHRVACPSLLSCIWHGNCDRCHRTKCDSCITEDGENWVSLLDEIYCPTCFLELSDGSDSSSDDESL